MIIERLFGKGRETQPKPRVKDEPKNARRSQGTAPVEKGSGPGIEATDAPASLIRAGEAPAEMSASAAPVAVELADVANPSYDEVAVRAYELWLSQGRPEGRERENWDEAERQLSLEGSRG